MAEHRAAGASAAAGMGTETDTASTAKRPASQMVPATHAPSLAGSVIETNADQGGSSYIRIQNISSTANLGVRLDLKKIALKCRNTEFNPRRFGAVIMRLREPRATALIFASGKMCVTGVKSAHDAALVTKKFAYIIERVGFKPVNYLDFKVQNIVGTTDVGFPIRLEGLVYAHSTFASYEPELFPGLIYRMVNPRVVFLVFVSGKIVITGAKTESDLSQAYTKLYPVLLEYRKMQVAELPGLPGAANTATTAGATGGVAVAAAAGMTTTAATAEANPQRETEEV